MAKRGGKKLPDKRGFVDGPGGYRGKDDRDKGLVETVAPVVVALVVVVVIFLILL